MNNSFNHKISFLAPNVLHVQLVTHKISRANRRASIPVVSNQRTVTMCITSTILPLTRNIGTALDAPSVPPALVILLGRAFLQNLDGPGATTTMLPLNVVLFQRLVWVAPTPPWWASIFRTTSNRLIWPTAKVATAPHAATPPTSMLRFCVANARTTTATTVLPVAVTFVRQWVKTLVLPLVVVSLVFLV